MLVTNPVAKLYAKPVTTLSYRGHVLRNILNAFSRRQNWPLSTYDDDDDDEYDCIIN